MNCFDGTDSENVQKLYQVLRYLRENSTKNIDFIIIELLTRTQIGGNCLQHIMFDAFKELRW